MNRAQFYRDLQDHLASQPRPVHSQSKLPKVESSSAQSLIRAKNPKSEDLVTLPSRHLPPLANTPPLNMPVWNSRSKASLPATSNPSSMPRPVLLESNLSPSSLPLASLPPKSLPPPKLPPIIMISCDYV